MEAGDDLAFTLGEVKRHTVGLGKGGGDEDDGAQGLQHHTPHGDEAEEQFSLELGDLRQVDRTVDHQQADQGEPHGDFVADHLGGGAEAAEHAVLVVRRPTCENDAVHREADDSQEPEDAEVRGDGLHQVLLAVDYQSVGEGNRCKGDQADRENDHRRQHKIEFVPDVGRNHIFLGEQFHRIGEVLDQAGGPEAEDVAAVRTGPVLDEGAPSTFHPDEDSDEAERHQSTECHPEHNKENIKLRHWRPR